MAFNATAFTTSPVSNSSIISNSSSILTSSNNTSQVLGWVKSDNSRGTIDILWSCCITIILSIWASTFPNAPSTHDKWYHLLHDKFSLACIGLLGPEGLFGVALGQFSSANRSVKLFRALPRPSHGRKWTLTHGFFADMGGFHLISPDYPAFPVNAEQLHYLVKHGHVDFPDLSKEDIKTINKTDTLSKLITLWQAFWFSVTELQRVRQGLSLTTFELTALSFSLTTLLTSLCWYAKPNISRPTTLSTRDGRSIEYIRAMARDSTHPDLPSTWYRTPLDFIPTHRRFRIDIHWSYYLHLSYKLHVPVFSRKITAKPWNRFPSDSLLFIDHAWLAPAFLPVMAGVAAPLIAWNFYFPTRAEQIAWQVCSVYNALFCGGCVAYYLDVTFRRPDADLPRKTPKARPAAAAPESQLQRPGSDQISSSKTARDVETGLPRSGEDKSWLIRRIQWGISWLKTWRNISPDGDPDMDMSLRATFFPCVASVLFVLCRIFFYLEDFISIRQQPASVFEGVNKFVPFIG